MTFKIAAKDQDDLTVLSALLQDGIVARSEMDFLPDEQRFAMIVTRFRWEQMPEDSVAEKSLSGDASYFDDDRAYHRVKSALRIEKVSAVQTKNLERSANQSDMYNILSLAVEGSEVVITLSDEAAIKVQTSALACYLEDIGEPWPSANRPNHEL